jgi:transcriptional repressor NrdR
VLQHLQKLDQVAYLRFASVYKDFQELGDFEREMGLLLAKKEPTKHRG